jgi:hypothetical protein
VKVVTNKAHPEQDPLPEEKVHPEQESFLPEEPEN